MTEPNDPLQQLWQHQETPVTTIDFDAIRRRSEDFAKTLRRRNLREYVAAVPVIGFFGALALFGPVPLLTKLGALLIVAATIVVTVRVRRMRPLAPPMEETTSAHLSALRRELERQRDSLAQVGRWYVAPFVPGVLLVQVGSLLGALARGREHVMLPWAANVTVTLGVLAVVVWVNRRAARKLDAEIRALPL